MKPADICAMLFMLCCFLHVMPKVLGQFDKEPGDSVNMLRSVCTLPVDRGVKCHAVTGTKQVFAAKKYFFDNVMKKCAMFFYYGCEGNANKFNSFRDCDRICGIQMLEKLPPLPDRGAQERATLEPPPPFGEGSDRP